MHGGWRSGVFCWRGGSARSAWPQRSGHHAPAKGQQRRRALAVPGSNHSFIARALSHLTQPRLDVARPRAEQAVSLVLRHAAHRHLRLTTRRAHTRAPPWARARA
eukprot:4959655-Prymnesium_polylepis.1